MSVDVDSLPDIPVVDEVATLDAYMKKYGGLLGQQLRSRIAPLHTPGKDDLIPVDTLRNPFPAQHHVITASVRALRKDKALIICGECGTGKTFVGMTTAHTHAEGKPYRALVFCPPHLVQKWAREISQTLPLCVVHAVNRWDDLCKLRSRQPPAGAEWWIISQNTAKLGPSWKPAYSQRKVCDGHRNAGHIYCPECSHPLVQEEKSTGILKPLTAADLKKRRCECKVCEAPLWQWDSQPRRWPGASYVSRQLRGVFDYLIIDEMHEEKGEDTAQGNAAGTLISACKKVIGMTGTLIGGQADHLRTLLYRLQPTTLVTHGYGWDDYMPFNERYGRIERRVTTKNSGASEQNRQSRGSSGKTTKIVRPGIMPTLFGDHLIGSTVFLSLEDVSSALPKLNERTIPVPMPADMAAHYSEMEDVLTAAIKQMAAKGDKRLLGSMLQALLCYPDKPYDWGPIGYDDTDEDGDRRWVFVYQPQNLPDDVTYPKEEQLVADCVQEKREGRQTWVYTTMTDKRDVLERLQLRLMMAGLRTCVLRADVPPKEREAWIYKWGKDADVILSHPKLVETGLDLFDKGGNHNFSTLKFYLTGYNLFTLRQASRRAWRIGQQHECRVHYYFYAGTMQERAMSLMGRKLVAAEAIEGKFSTDGLVAMAGEDSSVEMALAQSLVNRISDDLNAVRVWGDLTEKPTKTDENRQKPISPVRPNDTERSNDSLQHAAEQRLTESLQPAERSDAVTGTRRPKVFVETRKGQTILNFTKQPQLSLFD